MGAVKWLMLGLAMVFGAREAGIDSFERRAARAVSARLDGAGKKVAVKIRSGIEWGRVERARITASQFSIEGLPLFTDPDRSRFGRLDLLELRLSDFRLRGLRVDELSADLGGSRFDLGAATGPGELILSQSGAGRGSVAVRAEDLAAWLPTKVHEVKSCRVRIADGRVEVEGEGEFLILKTPFRVAASLEAPDGVRISLKDAQVWFGGRRAEEAAARAVLGALNPIVDLNEDLGLAGAIAVDRIELADGLLRASGEVSIPKRPGTAANP